MPAAQTGGQGSNQTDGRDPQTLYNNLLSQLGILKGGGGDYGIGDLTHFSGNVNKNYGDLLAASPELASQAYSPVNEGPDFGKYVQGLTDTDISNKIGSADISGFDTLAGQAGAAKTKGQGQNAINARGAYLANSNDAQREAIRRKYYGNIASNYDLGGGDFNSAVAAHGGGGQGDAGWLATLADDPVGGNNGNGGSGTTPVGTTTPPGPAPFDWNSWAKTFSDNMSNALKSGQQGAVGNASPAPAVSNTYDDAGARAAARNQGMFGSIATRRLRGRRSAGQRFF